VEGLVIAAAEKECRKCRPKLGEAVWSAAPHAVLRTKYPEDATKEIYAAVLRDARYARLSLDALK
jgi:hypothetical protein